MDVIKAFDTLALGFKNPEINNNVHTRIRKKKQDNLDISIPLIFFKALIRHCLIPQLNLS